MEERKDVVKCWAGVPISQCPYQSVGELLQVNPIFCRDCSQIKLIRSQLVDILSVIIGIDEIKESVRMGCSIYATQQDNTR